MEPATSKGMHARPTFEISQTNWNLPNDAHTGLAAAFDLPPQLQPYQTGRIEMEHGPPTVGMWRGGDIVWNRLARNSADAIPGWYCAG